MGKTATLYTTPVNFNILWRPIRKKKHHSENVSTFRDILGKHDFTPERFLNKPFLHPKFSKVHLFT